MRYLTVLFTAIILLIPTAITGQSLAWEDTFNLSGRIDRANQVVVGQNLAVTLGASGTAADGLDLVARAFDVNTGTVVWQDQLPVSPGVLTSAVADLDGTTVYAAGWALDGLGTDFVVVAHDLATGNRLWVNTVNKGRDDVVQDIAAGPSGVYVVGYGNNTQNSPLDYIVEAYDKQTGALLWEDILDHGGDDAAWRVVASGQMVLVAGTAAGTSSPPWDVILRAYNASTGALLWEASKHAGQPFALAANSFQAYVAGTGFLAAYNLNTGALAWEKQVGTVHDLLAASFGVYAAGEALGFHGLGGTTAWETTAVNETIRALALEGGTLYTTGLKNTGTESAEFLVRAHNALNGNIIWTDFSYASASTEGADIAVGGKVVAVGWALNPSGDEDAITRAYQPAPQALSWFGRSKMFQRFNQLRTETGRGLR